MLFGQCTYLGKNLIILTCKKTLDGYVDLMSHGDHLVGKPSRLPTILVYVCIPDISMAKIHQTIVKTECHAHQSCRDHVCRQVKRTMDRRYDLSADCRVNQLSCQPDVIEVKCQGVHSKTQLHKLRNAQNSSWGNGNKKDRCIKQKDKKLLDRLVGSSVTRLRKIFNQTSAIFYDFR